MILGSVNIFKRIEISLRLPDRILRLIAAKAGALLSGRWMSVISLKELILFFIACLNFSPSHAQSRSPILTTDQLSDYIFVFNSVDEEQVKNFVTNDEAVDWLSENIPLFDCPDSIIRQTYYYRWWTFRKHLKQTEDGFIFTEFIEPVGHATTHNAVSCALAHHIYEGRWLHNPVYIDDYISFWLFTEQYQPKSKFRSFSSWVDNAVYNRFLVNGDTTFLRKLFTVLHADYAVWEKERQLEDGMFWQHDVKDGMEESISGGRRVKNTRPTINSYMYGNALALAKMSALLNVDSLKTLYDNKAAKLKALVQTHLWNDSDSFFEVRLENGNLSQVREAIGFIPWYFNLPDDSKEFAKAWEQLIDTAGFKAPWGITTAEQRHPQFRSHGEGTCEWDGAVWPFATTQTLKGLSNLLTRYEHRNSMTAEIFFEELYKYARAHQKNGQPFIGEYQDEQTGRWLKGDHARSRFYNHSGFCDLIINDLIGLKPRADEIIEIHPLLPENKWDWFCLDNIRYHDHILTILWDKSGMKYGKGKGFRIYVDGKEIYNGKKLKPVKTKLKT